MTIKISGYTLHNEFEQLNKFLTGKNLKWDTVKSNLHCFVAVASFHILVFVEILHFFLSNHGTEFRKFETKYR